MRNKTSNIYKNNGGFSLVGLAISLVVGGILIVPIYMMIDQLMNVGTPIESMRIIRAALAEHVRVFGRLPFPSKMSLNPGDANFATEDSSLTPVNNIYIGALPIDNLRRVMDCEGTPPAEISAEKQNLLKRNIGRIFDIIGDSSPNSINTKSADDDNRKVIKTNCISMRQLVDKYGNKVLYAVTDTATATSTFDPSGGKIIIQDVNGNTTTVEPQLFVLVSFGKNAEGAKNVLGNNPPGCSFTSSKEDENCDMNNATFIDAPYNGVEGADYYDDEIDFGFAGVMQEQEFWRWKTDNSNADMAIAEKRRVIISNSKVTPNANDLLTVNGGNLKLEDSNNNGDGILETEGTGSSVQSTQFCYDTDCDGF